MKKCVDLFPKTEGTKYGIFILPVVPRNVETIVLIERVRNAKDFVQIGIDVEEYYRIKDEEN